MDRRGWRGSVARITHVYPQRTITIRFRETAIKLEDVEGLHSSLPKLKTLVLEKVVLYHNDEIGNLTNAPSKASSESFSLANFYVMDESQDSTNAV